ncbi:MAG TPA: glycosyltransferase [Acidobacteriaceae bacterium]|jgi:glycosyltransferase involved in cell wall biosynthesis
MKIAVVHDYFTQMGGAEKVAEELYNMLPGADLFATVALQNKMPDSLRHVDVHTSWMQRLPKMNEYYRLYFPLYPFAVSSLDLSSYDLIVSSSSGYAKGVRAHPDAIHVCYCHTPMRWVWSYQSYSARESFGAGIRAFLPTLIHGLRRWDEGAARQPDHFIANSQVVAKRIHEAYGRYAEVIAPPIEVHRFTLSLEQDDYFIILARLVSYKRIDLAIDAFSRLGKKLLVIGSGPALDDLKDQAGPSVRFMGRLPDREVDHLVSRCKALIFPGEEDFGMAPLEIAAAGRPTIAFRAGGAVETIRENVTGLFFDEQTPEALMDAVQRFEDQEWDPHTIRQHAEQFSSQVFRTRFASFLRRIGVTVAASV